MKSTIWIFAIILTITIYLQWSFVGISTGNYYYVIIFFIFLLLLFKNQILVNYKILWFLVFSLISIIFNKIPAFFRPYERFISFIIVMGLIGPLIINSNLLFFRNSLFKVFNTFLILLVVLSFLGIILRIPEMIGRGGVVGFFRHSMILSPLAGISTLLTLNYGYYSTNKIKKISFWILSIICFLTCIVGASRVAILGVLTGSLFFLYTIFKGRFKHLVSTILIITVIGALTYSVWEPFTEPFMKKIRYSESRGDVIYTRRSIWNTRLTEFKSSPFIGIGFASVSTENNKLFDEEGGQIEPGSSWMGVLSMTGFFGFIPLFLLLFQYLKLFYYEKENKMIKFLGSLFVFFVTHMFAEGYIISAGSILFFYFWLVMGLIEEQRRRILVK